MKNAPTKASPCSPIRETRRPARFDSSTQRSQQLARSPSLPMRSDIWKMISGYSEADPGTLAEWGFPVNTNYRWHESMEGVLEFCGGWEKKRDSLDYEIDGVVVKVDDLDYQRAPRHGEPRPALGGRFQVSWSGCDDQVEGDRRQRRPHGLDEPVRGA